MKEKVLIIHHKKEDTIEELLKLLPQKEYKIAVNLFKERDFSELEKFIWKYIVNIQKTLKKENYSEEYKKIPIDKLMILITLIDKYNIYDEE